MPSTVWDSKASGARRGTIDARAIAASPTKIIMIPPMMFRMAMMITPVGRFAGCKR